MLKLISLNTCFFSYEKKQVLSDISFSIQDKTTTAIVGTSGSGKTTICNLIARFWDVDSGEVIMGGRNIKEYTLEALMSQISMVFQNVYLFADTIENNIKFGSPNATHEDVVRAAKEAACDDFIESLPDGYNTIIGEGGASLSGGEKQRISIARAILKDSPVIILDEATANVDPENEDRLQKAIAKLTENKTIIMIAHRLKTVRNADQILVVDDGKIVDRGSHEELVAKEGLYRRFILGREEAEKWKI
ncbi:MAG: ATP-binding cassette domain-containing protein [Butyrivibrio sp.]|nr:ATP-binding cassette domain-containing protein [Butyrivibrio sp.]MCR4904416.1 ATP-binding cassette domain-containing protein [Butyrivibrio sp.]